MELSKQTYIDQIEIIPQANTIQYRIRTSVLEGDTEISYNFFRCCVQDDNLVPEIMALLEARLKGE